MIPLRRTRARPCGRGPTAALTSAGLFLRSSLCNVTEIDFCNVTEIGAVLSWIASTGSSDVSVSTDVGGGDSNGTGTSAAALAEKLGHTFGDDDGVSEPRPAVLKQCGTQGFGG